MSTHGSPDHGLVVIPALNEAATIDAVIARVRACAPALDILVVDDGSHDDTARHAARAGAAVVSHPINLGYGAALQTGYKYADRHGYAFVVQMDADGQHDAADVMRLVAPLTAGAADVVIGSRFVEDSGYRMGAARSAGRAFFKRLLVVCGGPRIDDPTSGFQASGARRLPLLLRRFLSVGLSRRRRASAAPPAAVPDPRDPGADGAEPSRPQSHARRLARALLPLQDAARDAARALSSRHPGLGSARRHTPPNGGMTMTPTMDIETLRRLIMDVPEAGSTRVVALLVSVVFLLAVLYLVRSGRLREEYTPIWTVVAVGIMVMSVWFDIVRAITRAVGAWTPSSTLFFFGEIFLLVLCLNYAVRLSSLTAHVKLLAQEMALLRAELADRRSPTA